MKNYCIITFLSILSLYSCKEGRNIKTIKEDFSNIVVDTSQINLDSLINELPDYESLVLQIIPTDFTYSKTHLLQDFNTAELNSKELALLFGMYSADLAYARYNERVQDCRNIMGKLNTLAGLLAIPPEMLNTTISSLETNIDKPEIVFQLADSIFYIASDFLDSNEMYGLSVIMTSGAYIESMRICSLISSTYSSKNDISISIYNSLTSVLNAFKGDDYIVYLKTEIDTLYHEYLNHNLENFDFEYIN